MAVVRDGKITTRRIANMNFTVDHRFADGSAFADFNKIT